MKKKTILLLSICMVFIMASCSMNANIPEEGERPIVTAYVQDVPSLRSLFADSRVSLVPSSDPEKGIDIKWNIGDKIPVSAVFRQGNIIKAAEVSTMTIIKDKDKEGNIKGSFEIKVPTGIDEHQLFEIAAVIGTDKPFEDDATIAIDKRHNIVSGEVPPMYFPFMKVQSTSKAGTTTLSVYPYFRFYGSILNIRIKNDMYDPINIPKADISSEMISSQGTMDLKTSTPTWTDTQRSKTYILNGGNYGAKGKKSTDAGDDNYCLIWCKPMTTTANSLTIQLHSEVGRDIPGTISDPKVTFTIKKQIMDDKAYDINMKMPLYEGRDLIITEFAGYWGGTRGALEIYNGTDNPIDFSKYYILTTKNGDMDINHVRTLQLGKTEGVQGKIRLIDTPNGADERETILKPGDILLLNSSFNTSELQTRWKKLGTPPSLAYQYQYYGDGGVGFINTTLAIKAGLTDFLAIAKGDAEHPSFDDIVDVIFRGDKQTPTLMEDSSYRRKVERIYGRKYDYVYNVNDGDNHINTNYIWTGGGVNRLDLGYRYRIYKDKTNGHHTSIIPDEGDLYKKEHPFYIYESVPDRNYYPKGYWNLDTAH